MKKSSRCFIGWSPKLPLVCVLASCLFVSTGRGQWIGLGTTGGTGNADINATSNWTSGIVSGNFTNITSTTTLTLSSATTTFSTLNFGWANQNSMSINSSSTGSARTIAFTGTSIVVPRSANSAVLTVTLGSDVTLDLGTFASTVTITSGGQATTKQGNLVLNGRLTGTASGAAGIAVSQSLVGVSNGFAGLVLNNTGNTFDAPITLSSALSFASIGNVGGGASALGAPTTVAHGTISMSSGGGMSYTGSTDQSSDRTITTIGAGIKYITHSGTAGTLTLTHDIANAGGSAQTLTLTPTLINAKLVITGAITDAGVNTSTGITQGGVGTVILSNVANTYKGVTTIGSGILEVTKLAAGGSNSSIGLSSNASANLIIGSGAAATLRYTGGGDSTDRRFTVGTLGATLDASGTGAINFTNTAAVTLTTPATVRTLTLTGNNTGANTLAAAIADGAGGGTTLLSKSGTGTWVVSGANTYTGTTNVTAGTLLANNTSGSATGSGNVTVASGAILGGNGTIGGTTFIAGIVSPGDGGIGTLNITGNVTWQGASSNGTATDWIFQLGASPTSDLLNITGNFTKDATTYGTNFRFNFEGATNTGTFKVVDWTGASSFIASDFSYTNLGSGFTGSFSMNGSQLDFSVLPAVPEPSTWVAMAALIITGGTMAMRRSTRQATGNL